MDKVNDKVLVTTFTCGLQPREFLFSFYKNDPKMIAETLYKAIKYMNTEYAMIARGDGLRKLSRTSERRDERRLKTLLGRTKNFTPLNTLLD